MTSEQVRSVGGNAGKGTDRQAVTLEMGSKHRRQTRRKVGVGTQGGEQDQRELEGSGVLRKRTLQNEPGPSPSRQVSSRIPSSVPTSR